MTAVLGPKPPAQTSTVEDFDKRIVDSRRPGCRPQRRSAPHPRRRQRMEQDHSRLARDRSRRTGRAVRFHGHAAPQQGAIILVDGVRLSAQAGDHRQCGQAAAKGHRARALPKQRSDIASTRYQAYLAAGVERWKEYREQLTPLSKKPVLFVMMNDTARGRRRRRLAAEEIPVRIRRREAADHSHGQVGRSVEEGPGRRTQGVPRSRRRKKSRSIASSAS